MLLPHSGRKPDDLLASDGVHMCCSASSVLVQYSRSVIALADNRNGQFGFHTELVGSRSSQNKGMQASVRSTGFGRCICYLLTLPDPERYPQRLVMKSTIFKLDPSAPTTTYNPSGPDYIYTFKLPLIPAFAVEYFMIHYGALSTLPDRSHTLTGDVLTVNPGYNLDDMDCRIVIFYHGIRDYSLLFPNVNPPNLQSRLGEFYREADAAFDAAAWLSFMLMCGALFEGILFFKSGANQSFNDLILSAATKGTIDSQTRAIMDSVRQYRNLVHANRYAELYVSRADAMDTRITLDRLLREM